MLWCDLHMHMQAGSCLKHPLCSRWVVFLLLLMVLLQICWTPSCTTHLRDAKAFAGHQIERDSATDLACGLL